MTDELRQMQIQQLELMQVTPEEYRELGDQFCKALKLYKRANTVIVAAGHERT